MNLKMNIKSRIKLFGIVLESYKNRRGSYIVEAAIFIPMFIIAMMLLTFVVPFISASENAVFITCDELHKADIRACFLDLDMVTPYLVKARIEDDDNLLTNVNTWNYGYLYSDGGMEDLISLNLEVSFGSVNPLGEISTLIFRGNVVSRAFTGKQGERNADREVFSKNEDYEAVYIFPREGKKYHNRGCPFLNPACEQVFYSREIGRDFRKCEKCIVDEIRTGDVVFCFFNSGEKYHVSNCSHVDKVYVEIDEREAQKRGYTRCITCGG